MYETIARQIKNIRNKNNLSQARFGKKIGVTGKAISAYETGRATPPLKILENIAITYDTNIANIGNKDTTQICKKLEYIQSNLNDLRELLNKQT